MATITPQALIKLESLYIEKNHNQAPETINQECFEFIICPTGHIRDRIQKPFRYQTINHYDILLQIHQ